MASIFLHGTTRKKTLSNLWWKLQYFCAVQTSMRQNKLRRCRLLSSLWTSKVELEEVSGTFFDTINFNKNVLQRCSPHIWVVNFPVTFTMGQRSWFVNLCAAGEHWKLFVLAKILTIRQGQLSYEINTWSETRRNTFWDRTFLQSGEDNCRMYDKLVAKRGLTYFYMSNSCC